MLTFNGRTLKVSDGALKVSPPPIYQVTCSATHGTVIATPSSGLSGTTITLSGSPDEGYEFDYYTVNGIQIVGNTFTLTGDTTVTAVYKAAPLDYVTINGIKWATRYATQADFGVAPAYTRTIHGETIAYFSLNQIEAVSPPAGWRMSTADDITNIINSGINGSTLISELDGGTNTSGLGLFYTGYYTYNGTYSGTSSYFNVYAASRGTRAINVDTSISPKTAYLASLSSRRNCSTPYRLIKI